MNQKSALSDDVRTIKCLLHLLFVNIMQTFELIYMFMKRLADNENWVKIQEDNMTCKPDLLAGINISEEMLFK